MKAVSMSTENPSVYSTELGRLCPNCGRPIAQCICHKSSPQPKGSGAVRILRETKGRKGKTVTLITGLALNETGLRDLLTHLKKCCGAGGAMKDGDIEIQGDHREVILAELKKRGNNAKIAGG
jgi:translation initiation factor 1